MKVANLTASGALAQQGQERDGDNRAFQKCAISSLTHRTRISRLKKKSLATHSLVFTRSPPNIPHVFGLSRTFHPSLIPRIFTCVKPNVNTSNS